VNPLTLSVISHGHADMLNRLVHDMAALPSLAGSRLIVTLNLAGESFDPSAFPSLDIRVIRNTTPRGFGANHNAAFQACESPWFVVLNPDLRLTHGDPFPRLLARAEQAQVQAIAPRIVSSHGQQEDSVRSNLTPWSLMGRQLLGKRRPLQIDGPARRGKPFYWLAGMFLMLDSRTFRSIRGFDERYFLYCEDYDLCARLYAQGHGLDVELSAAVVHDAQRDSHRSRRHMQWHLGGLLKVWTSKAFWQVSLFG
jgi:N-acetylglucosaminyl-diphospho-decaprenol L-rhamnosyltransferase